MSAAAAHCGWFDVLCEDVRNVVRDALGSDDDYVSLASLRMTCRTENVEQRKWFQAMPETPQCNGWAFLDADETTGAGPELVLRRPRGNFLWLAQKMNYPLLVSWALWNEYKCVVPPIFQFVRVPVPVLVPVPVPVPCPCPESDEDWDDLGYYYDGDE